MLVIGDVHGKFDEYYNLVKDEKSSFQIGDFGFGNKWLMLHYLNLDPKFHKVGQGNHDPHDILNEDAKNWTGRYGPISVDGHDIFWIGGALSIDLAYRVVEWISRDRNPAYRTWWANEQLTYQEMRDCEKKWKNKKPRIVFTHTCPRFIILNHLKGNKSGNIMDSFGWGSDYTDMTSQFLEHLWGIHKPDLWIFGHFHKSWNQVIDGTEFRCLAELETFRL